MWCTFHLQEKYLLGTHNKTPYSFLLKNLSSHNAVGHQVIKPSQHHDNTNMQRSGFKPSAKLVLGKSIEKCKLCKNCKFYTIGYQAKIFFLQKKVFPSHSPDATRCLAFITCWQANTGELERKLHFSVHDYICV